MGSAGPTYEIAKALQDYGGYIVDMGGAPLILFSDEAAADELGGVEEIRKHGGGTGLLMTKVIPHLRVVTNNTPSSLGGGGTPRRPLAPPFDAEFLKAPVENSFAIK